MIDIIKAEFQKSKRTTTNKFIIIAPLFSVDQIILLAFIVMKAY